MHKPVERLLILKTVFYVRMPYTSPYNLCVNIGSSLSNEGIGVY